MARLESRTTILVVAYQALQAGCLRYIEMEF